LLNDFVKINLGDRGSDLIGNSMWEEFKEMSANPSFKYLNKIWRKGRSNVTVIFPVTGKRLNISGYFRRLLLFFRIHSTRQE